MGKLMFIAERRFMPALSQKCPHPPVNLQ